MAERPALEVVGVTKRYGNCNALSGVDLVAQPGRLHGLLGPNGAGKTTLMRVLLGLVRRDAGTVRLLGRDLHSTGGPVPEGVAGFVEAPSFYPYLSGRQNLSVLARLDGGEAARRTATVDDALEQVGLHVHASAAVAGYSAGMRQRLGIAAAVIRSPRLLFLDEPTNSLDPAGARAVRVLARRLADDGAAVVLSSHDMAEVEELCTTLTVIDRGRVIFSGTVAGLKRRAPAAIHVMHTSNDCAALDVASDRPDMRVTQGATGSLEVSGDIGALDAYVIALGCAGVAVRALERRTRSLESLFLELPGSAAAREPVAAPLHDARTSPQASTAVS
jgi:ABC-2 type transport system ATP-binding protein